MIVKNIIGTLEVDPDSKSVWVNSLGECVMRLIGEEFIGFDEKFSSIHCKTPLVHFSIDHNKESDVSKYMPYLVSLVVFLISLIDEGKVKEPFFKELEKEIRKKLSTRMEVGMTILDDLLNEMSSGDRDETLKKLCDAIFEQERPKMKKLDMLPTGPNIFLALECPEDFLKYNFICLEREERNKFIVSHWCALKKDPSKYRRVKVWDCENLPANKIMQVFLEKYEFLRGR